MNPLFTETELSDLGFTEKYSSALDDGGYYRWWVKKFGALSLHLTYEYNAKDEVVCYYFEIGDEKLKENITKEEVLTLIRVLG